MVETVKTRAIFRAGLYIFSFAIAAPHAKNPNRRTIILRRVIAHKPVIRRHHEIVRRDEVPPC
jgi:hypothetical protein